MKSCDKTIRAEICELKIITTKMHVLAVNNDLERLWKTAGRRRELLEVLQAQTPASAASHAERKQLNDLLNQNREIVALLTKHAADLKGILKGRHRKRRFDRRFRPGQGIVSKFINNKA
ncbi:MAG: hypothetical protein GY868_15520 [Deltaproteobacteria bacterium]|nr:hypothetical protein [Deltaproteobacteria bacterium]